MTGRRVFLLKDFMRLMLADNIANAYLARKQSGNFARWTSENERAAQLLADIERTLED